MLENSYWNIDSILHGMTKKECKLNYDLDCLKDLFPGQENNNQFKKNEIVKLPMTLSLSLSSSEAEAPDGILIYQYKRQAL